MKTIHKFKINPPSVGWVVEIQMPEGAKILHVATQGNDACLWAMVDTDQPMTPRYIEIYGTGHEIPDRAEHAPAVHKLEHLGTFMFGNALVFHAFERTPDLRYL